MSVVAKLQRILYQLGAYKCSHFRLQKIANGKKKSCCGGKGDEYAPICGLVNAPCPGLAQCPRLDVTTKSALIQEWTKDVRSNTSINPVPYIKD